MRSRIPKNLPQEPEFPAPKAKSAHLFTPMSDEEFWQELDKIATKEQTFESTQEFVRLLRRGYHDDNCILIYGSASPNDENDIHQIFTQNSRGRSMLYLTDRRHFHSKGFVTPAFSTIRTQCYPVLLYQVIDNALEKDSVTELRFNPGTDHEFVIPKMMLQVILEL